MKRRQLLSVLGSAIGGGLVVPRAGGTASRPDGEHWVERWSWAMGQPVHLRLFAGSESAGLEAASLAFAELRRVEAALSRFDPSSDLVALNERAGRGPVRVSPDLLAVLRQAEWARRVTEGAFDPAVEPLMRAWGFHAARSIPPGPADLQEAVRAVREARIILGDGTAALATSSASLDLGGIGVGYGLDRVATVLRAKGIRRALLEVSGDLIALGSPPGRTGWPVDLAIAPGKELGSVNLKDAALATSANTISVVRYRSLVAGHVMNPATGTPARGMVQATVVSPRGFMADALSTAALVQGRIPPFPGTTLYPSW